MNTDKARVEAMIDVASEKGYQAKKEYYYTMQYHDGNEYVTMYKVLKKTPKKVLLVEVERLDKRIKEHVYLARPNIYADENKKPFYATIKDDGEIVHGQGWDRKEFEVYISPVEFTNYNWR